jgi:sugar phosphate isomerase/epimerase
MTRPAIQLYTLRELSDSLPALLRRVGDTEFEGVEFAHRYADADPSRVAAALDEAGLKAVAAHVGLDAMVDDAERLREDYAPVGCRRFVLPHVPPERLASRPAIDALAERLNAAAAAVEAAGGRVAYHNQAHDFQVVEGQSALDRLLARTDRAVGLELDVGGVVTAGVDPLDIIDRHGERITMIHCKDVSVERPAPDSPQTCVPIGTGDVDLGGVARAAKTADVEWLVYENDEPEMPTEALQRGARVLTDLR